MKLNAKGVITSKCQHQRHRTYAEGLERGEKRSVLWRHYREARNRMTRIPNVDNWALWP